MQVDIVGRVHRFAKLVILGLGNDSDNRVDILRGAHGRGGRIGDQQRSCATADKNQSLPQVSECFGDLDEHLDVRVSHQAVT